MGEKSQMIFNNSNALIINDKKRLGKCLIGEDTISNFETIKIETDNRNEINIISNNLTIEKHGGLFNKTVIFILILWYMISAFSLFTNKYILSTYKGDPTFLGLIQTVVTCVFGFIQISYDKIFHKQKRIIISEKSNLKFFRDMLLIGILRVSSIILCLFALKFTTISFVETVKSSAPIFIVVLSRILIGEKNGFWTKLTLVPIMFGLALFSSTDISFNFIGFTATIMTNLIECLQLVVSKILLCNETYKYSPLQIIVFTSLASCTAIIPICLYTVDVYHIINNLNKDLIILYSLNACSYYGQTILAFTLISYISPVTYSVFNTLKRAVLIWVSVIIFNTEITSLSALGSLITIGSVFLYNHVRFIEKKQLNN